MSALPGRLSALRRSSGRGAILATALALAVVPFAGVAPAAADDVVDPPVVFADPTRTVTPVVSGTLRVGETLTVEPGVWTPEATFSYQWLRDGNPIDGATAAQYTLVAGDLGASLTVEVTGASEGLPDATAVSDPTPPVEAGVLAAATPMIVGAAQVGRTLTVEPGAWTPPAELTYQWLVDGVAINGATLPTYVVAPGNLGAVITVQVSGTAAGYEPVSVTSAGTLAVKAGVFTAPAPTISGTAQVGKTLTAAAGTWVPSASLTYQWYRGGGAISGATRSTYLLASADLGAVITVRVSGTAAGYEPASVTSAATPAVKAALFTSAPVPKISGTAQVGKTLTATAGTWAPGATLAYQWFRNGAAVTGATRTTYALVAADLGKTMTVRVTATRVGYAPTAKTSAKTAAVKAGTLTSPVPTLPSTVRVGAKVTPKVTGWTAGTTLTRQWYLNGRAIAGATATSYTPHAADRGKTLTLRVTGKKAGYTTVTRTSVGRVVGYGVLSAPTPKIKGTARVGQTLSVSRGTWSPAASTYSYQWRANGTAIKGATKSSYKLTSAQRGKRITVSVTGRRAGYATKSVKSTATAVVLQSFVSAPKPRITGTARVGSTLTVSRGTWSPTPRFTYQWKANGVAISGATGTSLRLTTSHAGKTITVTVTGRATGWVTTSRTSAATAKVTRLSVPGTGGYDCPAGYPIKGNADSGIYHVPGGQYYNATKPEECFATEAAAVAAGYRKSKR